MQSPSLPKDQWPLVELESVPPSSLAKQQPQPQRAPPVHVQQPPPPSQPKPQPDACDCRPCRLIRERDYRLVSPDYAPCECGNPLPKWFLDALSERPSSRTMIVVCVVLVVVGWGMLVAAAAYASASKDPVRVSGVLIWPPILMTLALAFTIGYSSPRTTRRRRLEEAVGEDQADPSFLRDTDQVADEQRRNWSRAATLLFAAAAWGTGAILDCIWAFTKWIDPPPAAEPQPLSAMPGTLLLLQVLFFFLAAAARYFTVSIAEQEHEENLLDEAKKREADGTLEAPM